MSALVFIMPSTFPYLYHTCMKNRVFCTDKKISVKFKDVLITISNVETLLKPRVGAAQEDGACNAST